MQVTSFGVQSLGLPFASATNLLIIINGIGVPARLIPAFIADKTGPLNSMVPISCCLVLVAWSWLAVHNVAGLYVFVCFYGMMTAALQCLIPPTVASLTSDMRVIGTRIGMAFFMMGLGALTGPPIGGALISAQGGSYVGARIWAAMAASICLVLLFCARMSRAGWRLRSKV